MLHAHPEWTHKALAAWVGRSLGWVKKWVKRLRDASEDDISVLFGLPRGRRTPYPQLDPLVEERILAIRESPPEHLQRVPGPKAILYYLARDAEVLEHAVPLPRSTRTIWKVLRRHGCIVRPIRLPPQPMERPAPMSAWHIDFKDASTVPADPHGKQQHVVEILNVVEMGTSIVIASQVHANFHAQTALQAMASILRQQARPPSITYDRDPRWVGAASGRDFPSAFCRFLWCLGIQTIVCPAHRPDLNAFVERYHRTLKYEWLLIACPQTEEQVREVNETFVAHYNQERPTQARSCGNQPPRVAFAELPPFPRVPDVVDPDRWLRVIDGQHFVRKVRHNGTVLIDEVGYSITQSLAGQYVDVCVDADQQAFVIWHQHQPYKRVAIKGLQQTALAFDRFVELMSHHALSEQRRMAQAHRKVD